MTERWINQSENLLKAMDAIASKKERDRLEMINSMIFVLNTIDRSLRGWRSWIQNLAFMSKFTPEELKELEEGLIKSTRVFVDYDIEVTKKYLDKIPRIKFTTRRRKKRDQSSGIIA